MVIIIFSESKAYNFKQNIQNSLKLFHNNSMGVSVVYWDIKLLQKNSAKTLIPGKSALAAQLSTVASNRFCVLSKLRIFTSSHGRHKVP